MSATSPLFQVTETSSGTTSDISGIDIVVVTASGSGSKINYMKDGATPITLIVTETPAVVSAASEYLIPLTDTATSATFYINCDRIRDVFTNGSGANVQYDQGLGNDVMFAVNETRAAVRNLQAAAISSLVNLVVTETLTSTATRALSITTTSALTAGNIVSTTTHQTLTAASATNTTEMAQFILTSAVQVGNWANAVLAKIDFTTIGYVTGLAGVICAELDMPSTPPAGGNGTYTCFEAEINMASASTEPVSAMCINAWGTSVAQFDSTGYLFDITGLTKASGKIFQDNTAGAASQALRIRVNGTPYYIMLTSTGA